MKFGNIEFIGREKCNLGDNLQLSAIEDLYAYMGIDKKEIVRIPYDELSTWADQTEEEKVILPINFPFLQYINGGERFRFSSKIRPVYLGCALLRDRLSDDEVQFYKSNEPIGCRDEYTYNIMKKYGISSWLNGCMTLCINREKYNYDNRLRNKIYLVDVNEYVLDYFADKDVSIKTQIFERNKIKNGVAEYIHEYFQDIVSNAKLVITSRLHCASPCISLGIPVILVVDMIPMRFSWIDKLCYICSSNEICSIDFERIYAQDITKIKSIMLNNAALELNRLFYGKNYTKTMMDYKDKITQFYNNRNRHKYYVEGYDLTVAEAKKISKNKNSVRYSFWGLTELAEMLYLFFENNLKNFELYKIYDIKSKMRFHEFETEYPYFMENTREDYEEDIIFVTASAATIKAQELNKYYKSNVFFPCYGFEYTRMRLSNE